MAEQEHRMLDFYEAKLVEVTFGPDGELWVNVDGICRLRSKAAKRLVLDHPDYPNA